MNPSTNAKMKTKRHFNETASDYSNSNDGKFVQPMYEALVKEINRTPGGKLLDVGCGNGMLFTLLSEEQYEMFGIDFSENMITEAEKACGDKASFCVADAEKLPFDGDTFDMITCNASFHHYIHPDTVLMEMNRVLKPGGMLIIGDPYIPAFVRPLMNVLTKLSNEGDYHFYGMKEMKKHFLKNGFSPISAERTGEHTALYTAKKI